MGTLIIAFAVWQGLQLVRYKNKTKTVDANVIYSAYAFPKGSKYNSKWATVSYFVQGKRYVSKRKIQVPLTADIGSIIKIRYYEANPNKIAEFSPKKFYISFIIGVLFFIIGFYM